MKRRTIGLIVTLALCLALLAADAQPPKKVPRIGYLAPAPRSASGGIDAFREGLRELGYVEGQNIAIESRFTEGRDERARDLATELVQLGVDVIVAASTAHALAAKHAMSTIPIVFVGVGDPVARGLVTSIARPGGNLTGVGPFSSVEVTSRNAWSCCSRPCPASPVWRSSGTKVLPLRSYRDPRWMCYRRRLGRWGWNCNSYMCTVPTT